MELRCAWDASVHGPFDDRSDWALFFDYARKVRRERDRVRAENAKLRENLKLERSENGWAREFLDSMGQKCGTKDCPSLVTYVTKLEGENAKLRELVRFMWFADYAGHFSTLPEHQEHQAAVWQRMCELGIEVE